MTTFSGEHRQHLVDLVDYPRENLGVEIKNWLDLTDPVARADVACALLALANSGGGFLIFGFDEGDGAFVFAFPRPENLARYGQDEINGIVARYAEPTFEVAVEFVQTTHGSSTHPVVIVPGDLDTPVRARRDGPERQHVTQNTYYVRRPGPASAPIQTGREWDELLDRCIRTKRELLIDRIRDIIEGPSALSQATVEEADEGLRKFIDLALNRWEEIARAGLPEGFPGRYSHGTWYVAYRVLGDVADLPLQRLQETLRQVVGRETGWPAWWVPDIPEIAPRPWERRVECWMAPGEVFRDSGHADYWLADRAGFLFLLRGYEDDSEGRGAPREPGTTLDVTIPIWRIGECLLHAERFARAITAQGFDLGVGDHQRDLPRTAGVEFSVEWRGLANRRLSTWASPMRMSPSSQNRGQASVRSTITVQAAEISDRLPEIVQALTEPLYESFSLFEPSPQLIREELESLRGRR